VNPFRIISAAPALAMLIAAFAPGAGEAQGGCNSHAWTNAFHPDQPVAPKASLFSREGTLVCPTLETIELAANAMIYGWRYVPAAGVDDPPGMRPGMSALPESFGCSIVHDGAPITLKSVNAGVAETSIGWVPEENLRN
jgi:hypothetical protein